MAKEKWQVNKTPARPNFPKTARNPAQLAPREAEEERIKAELSRATERLERSLSGLRATAKAHGLRPTAKPERQSEKVGWQIKHTKQLLLEAFPPDGHPPAHLTLQAIQNRLRPLVKKGCKEPSTDTIARALGRRGRRT
jgi:hypothetical protein